MGNDFSNHHLFAGGEPEALRERLIHDLRQSLLEERYLEVDGFQDADRVIAIGPADRWICVLDSYGNGKDRNPAEFKWLSLHLSVLCPVVDIHLEDSIALHLCLFREGRRDDRFGNRKGVASVWRSDEERKTYVGNPTVWTDLLIDSQSADTLRHVWHERDATKILTETTALFGWNPGFSPLGYFMRTEGEWTSYRNWLSASELIGFTEIYYRKFDS